MAANVLDEGILITYHGVLPVLVVFGVIGSVASIWVLIQPSLKKVYANRYFLVLAVYDLALNIFYIPIIVTATGCSIADYGSAWYFAHFGWTTACIFHALSAYVIVFLSLDRFVGAWFPTWFKRLQKPPFGFWHRMTVVAVLCVGIHVPYMVDAAVECCEWEEGQRMPRADLQCQSNYSSCSNGSWVSIDGYEYSFDKTWHNVYRYFYMLMVRWLPSVLLLVFNISLVVAVSLGKVTFPGSSAKNEAEAGTGKGTVGEGCRRITRNSERILVTTAIAMTASFVLLTLPITIFLTGLANTGTERCVYSSHEETVRHVGNVFQLLEHVIHVVFLLCINPRFKREMLYQLRCRELPGEEGDTTTPDIQLGSSNRPINSASRSFSSVRVRDYHSTVPLSCH